MKTKAVLNLTAIFLLMSCCVTAQEKWNLLKCIQYALDNNISIRQTALQENFSELSLKQSRLALYPSANASLGVNYSSGRNQDPTTFSLITQGYLGSNMGLQSSVDIFNWHSKRNTVAAAEWELQAARANTDKLKNDIALLVASQYLQVLLAAEQEKIARVQLSQSKAQLSITRKMVDAGSLPELNAAELEAQTARDSATVVTAKGATTQALLSIKATMNMDAAQPFDIEIPSVESIPLLPMAELQPDVVYAAAMANLPQQRFNNFKLRAAEKSMLAARGAMYPTLSGNIGLGASYNNRAVEITGFDLVNAPLGSVNVGGTNYNVFPLEPFKRYSTGNVGFFRQLNENFRQSIGLTLTVPIFNGGQARTAWQRSRLSIKNLELQQLADNQKTKQDIYLAYNNAIVAMEKFNAGKKSVETAERSFSFAQKRYNIGMLGTLELITNQNNLFREKLQNTLDHFDYVFKMKVLEFYRGQGLKL